MKRLLTCLILVLVSSSLLFADIPSDSQIRAVWDSRPELIVSMVQKLYVLEHAEPVIDIPPLAIIETKDNALVLDYQGNMTMEIGEAPNNLSYEIELSPKEVTVATRPDEGPSIWFYIGGGALLFAGGVIAGSVVTGVLSSR